MYGFCGRNIICDSSGRSIRPLPESHSPAIARRIDVLPAPLGPRNSNPCPRCNLKRQIAHKGLFFVRCANGDRIEREAIGLDHFDSFAAPASAADAVATISHSSRNVASRFTTAP